MIFGEPEPETADTAMRRLARENTGEAVRQIMVLPEIPKDHDWGVEWKDDEWVVKDPEPLPVVQLSDEDRAMLEQLMSDEVSKFVENLIYGKPFNDL